LPQTQIPLPAHELWHKQQVLEFIHLWAGEGSELWQELALTVIFTFRFFGYPDLLAVSSAVVGNGLEQESVGLELSPFVAEPDVHIVDQPGFFFFESPALFFQM